MNSKAMKKLRADREANKPLNQAIAELKQQGYQFRPIKGKRLN
ncbi:hypothetical protein [Ignatzschineria sp. LJL83]